MEETKPLTPAQQQHLAALLAEKQRVEEEIRRFMGYLALEHDAPASHGWTHIDGVKGFVRQVDQTP